MWVHDGKCTPISMELSQAEMVCPWLYKSHAFADDSWRIIMLAISPIGSMYGIYANIGAILMVNVTIYTIHGSYGSCHIPSFRQAHLLLVNVGHIPSTSIDHMNHIPLLLYIYHIVSPENACSCNPIFACIQLFATETY